MKLPCYLVRDLLSLYKDELCEPETAADLRAHLDSCPDCRALWEKMQTDAPLEREAVKARAQEQADVLRRVRKNQRKKRMLTVLAAVAATLCAVTLGLGALYEYARTTYPDYGAEVIEEVRYEEQGIPGNSPFAGEGLYATLSAEASGALVSSKMVDTEDGTAVVFTVSGTLWQQWLDTLGRNAETPANTRTAICTAGGYGQAEMESLCAAYYLPYHSFMSWFYKNNAPLPEDAILLWQRDAS